VFREAVLELARDACVPPQTEGCASAARSWRTAVNLTIATVAATALVATRTSVATTLGSVENPVVDE
jgi:hypothetical protein